jgi:hypothetical protein
VRGVRGHWAFGDAAGDVKRRNVWILRNRLDKGPLPTATKQPISNTREYLKRRDASWISPGRSDGVSAKLKQETVLYGNYNPRTGKFSDRIKELDPDRKNRELHMRYISKDRDAAVVRYSGVDPTRRDAKGKPKTTFSQWGFVKREDVRRR